MCRVISPATFLAASFALCYKIMVLPDKARTVEIEPITGSWK